MAEMNAALRAEGQRTLIIGDRAALRNDTSRGSGVRVERWINTFTANDDGSIGYNLEGDRPSGEVSARVCVRAKLTHIRLYDARRPGTPAGARRGDNSTGCCATTRRWHKAHVAGGHDLNRRGRVGAAGLSVTLQGNVTGRSGMLMAHHPDGQARDMFMMENVAYTPAGLERLD